jgi:hypothetical protein
MRRIKATFLLCLLGSLIAAAIVSAAESPFDLEQRLRERASAYWDAAQAGDLSTMYQMELAAKEGRLKPETARDALGTSTIVNYEFAAVDVTGDDGVVTVNVRYRLPGLRGLVPMTRQDPWTFVEGDWYHGWSAAIMPPK